MPSDPSITPNAAPSEGSTRRQGPADGSNGGLAVPDSAKPAGARTELWAAEDAAYPPSFAWLCLSVRNCPDAGRELYATTEEAQRASDRHVAQVHGQKPPAARVPASQRPEVAGEPESGQDGAAGREAAPGRRALTMREIRVALGHRVDFDGCHAECRKAGVHSLRWGGCEFASAPPPTVSLSRVYTDSEDGGRSICFDTVTVHELAELIEPALRDVAIRLRPSALALLQDGHELRLSSAEIGRLALAAADAIITHSNRDAT